MAEQRWIPLESDPELFNSWAKEAGLVMANAEFQDVYGLEEDLLNLVKQPVRAVILLFPDWEDGIAKRKEEDEKIARDGQPKLDKTIMWIKQTIGNACGTMAILHALANSDVTIAPMSPLSKLFDQCRDKTPLERAKILETTPILEEIHTKMASAGQSHIPNDLHVDLHYIAFVEAPDEELREQEEPVAVQAEDATGAEASQEEVYSGKRLIELDGERDGPIDRGECKDLLKDVAKFVKERFIGESSSIQFNLIALGGPVNEEEGIGASGEK